MISRIILVVGIILVLIGIYLILLYQAPRLPGIARMFGGSNSPGEDRIKIESLNIDEPILEGGPETLEQGIWHRFPERGNPVEGGNFILSGHRFVLASTPGKVFEQSRFYRINELEEGDSITVLWKGEEYVYDVVRTYTVDPNAIEIEAPSGSPILTIYSCTLGGSYDGRVVVEARPTE